METEFRIRQRIAEGDLEFPARDRVGPIEGVLRRGLALNPRSRYASAADMWDGLASALDVKVATPGPEALAGKVPRPRKAPAQA